MTITTAPTVSVDPALTDDKAMQGGIEGARRDNREMALWAPPVVSPDSQINPLKDMADSRVRDMVQNDGYAIGAVNTHRDSIVGNQYRLNAQPDYQTLGADEKWADEFQEFVENRFNLLAESSECWLDAAGRNTFTDMVRLTVAGFVMTGEHLSSVEWLRDPRRPFRTALQAIHPSRLSNPDMGADTKHLRKGVQIDNFGRAQAYHVQVGYPNDFYDGDISRWRKIPAALPWGRRQVIHIIEQLQPGQTRGLADLVYVLKTMKMTRKFRELTLQKAVISASYAAAIESELPKEMIFSAMGGTGNGSLAEALGQYMAGLTSYLSGAPNIKIDDAKIPHLYPGTKLSMYNIGEPGGVGGDFESALLRHTCAALGVSYEQFTKDYSKVNYSGARASLAETGKYMAARKRAVADRYANHVYSLVMEEWINSGELPLPKGRGIELFYDPVMREALLNATWIGGARGQIDELKETQASIMRMNGNISTLEIECANFGLDYRKVLRQRAKERKLMDELGLDPTLDATKPGTNERQKTMTDKQGDEDNE